MGPSTKDEGRTKDQGPRTKDGQRTKDQEPRTTESPPSADFRLTPTRNLIQAAELLHSLPGVDLGRIDVALHVDGDVVHDVELPRIATGTTNATENGVRRAVDDAHLVVHAIHHVDQRLLSIG